MLVRIPLHPIDTCKAKLQVQKTSTYSPALSSFTAATTATGATPSSTSSTSMHQLKYNNFRNVLTNTYKLEGIRGLYRGFGITFFGSAPATCFYFT
jgi:hypothetical protein